MTTARISLAAALLATATAASAGTATVAEVTAQPLHQLKDASGQIICASWDGGCDGVTGAAFGDGWADWSTPTIKHATIISASVARPPSASAESGNGVLQMLRSSVYTMTANCTNGFDAVTTSCQLRCNAGSVALAISCRAYDRVAPIYIKGSKAASGTFQLGAGEGVCRAEAGAFEIETQLTCL